MSTKAKAAAALNKPQRQSQVALMNRHCFFTDRVMPWLGTGLAALIIVPFAFQIVICTALGFIFDKSGLNALIASIGNHKFWHRFVTEKVNGQIAAWALWLSVCTFFPCALLAWVRSVS
jgi:ABC-type spermidine/putrescine transport system permease subunit I